MISAFIIYAIALSVVLSVAAALLEKALAAMGGPRRAAWLAAMLLSVIVPIVAQTSASQLQSKSASPLPVQNVSQSTASVTLAVAPETTLPAHVSVERSRDFAWPSLPSLDSALSAGWLVLSGGVFLFYGNACCLLRRQRRTWRAQRLDGTDLLVSDNVGPAVIGFWHSRIVVPRWLISAHYATRALALRHEAEHIAARDPFALLLAVSLVALMPWNIVLWWQLRRLRMAIELDCDARVLRGNVDAADYGEALLLVGRRHQNVPPGAIALTEPPSFLEKRIRIMMTSRPRFAVLTAVCCVLLCSSLVAATTQIDAPTQKESILLPPPQPGLLQRVEGSIRVALPELFEAPLSEPVLVNALLDNDFTIEIVTKKTLAPGTTFDAASPPGAPNNGFTAEQLHPADERWGGRWVYQDGPGSAPVFLNFAVRGVHRTRSASVVEPIIRATLPQLYDAQPDGKVLVTALFGDSGTLKIAKHAPYTSDDELVGHENHLKKLASAGAALERIHRTDVIGGSETAPFRPAILYAFEKSDDPRVETHPLNPETLVEVAAQRSLVERHFPSATTQEPQPHELLWILLNTQGEVIRAGRTPSDPEQLAASIDSVVPGTSVFIRRTRAVGELLDREVLDVLQQPVLVTFLWAASEAAASESESDVIVGANIYRNGELVSDAPLALRFGEQDTNKLTDAFRVEMTAIDVNDSVVELRMRLQARAEKKGVEFADPWETASTPAIRIGYGQEGVVELGLRYPEASEGELWRLVLKPERVAARTP